MKKTIVSRAKRLGKLLANIFNIETPQNIISFKDNSYIEYSLDFVEEAKGLKPISYTLEGESVEIDGFKEMLDSVLLKLYHKDPSIIESIAKNNKQFVSWSKRVYISYDKSLFKYYEQIEDSGIYYNINLSSSDKLSIIKSLLNEYNIDFDEFSYTAKRGKYNNKTL